LTRERRLRGAAGEAAARRHLEEAGYRIVAANWRCRLGEIDLVAERGGTLVIVEVRSRAARSLGTFGAPLESVTLRKRATLRRCAEWYVAQLPAPPERVRFDCVGVVLDDANAPVHIEHIENAF